MTHRLICCLFLMAAVLTGVSGCRLFTTPETAAPLTVDPDAPVLFRGDLAPVLDRIDRQLDQWSARLIRKNRPGQEPVPQLTLLTALRMALDLLAGDREIPLAAASTPLSPFRHAPFYRNELVLRHHPDDANGLLWKISGTANDDLTGSLRAVPANALLAATFSLDTETAAVCAARLLPVLTGHPLPDGRLDEIAAAISGQYGLLVLPLEDEQTGLIAVIPDRNARLHRLLATMYPIGKDGAVMAPDLKGYFLHNSDTTLFFSAPEAQAAFIADAPLLLDDPAAAPLYQDRSFNGTGFLYLADTTVLPDRWHDLRQPTLLILSAGENGLRADIRAAWNWTDLLTTLLLPAAPPTETTARNILALVQNQEMKWLENTDSADCTDRMRQLYQALMQYHSTNGTFPAPAGLAGLRLLVQNGLAPAMLLCPAATADLPANGDQITPDNCSYLYFGPPEDAGDTMPLLMDWPKNHRDRFGVLFANGDIRFFPLPAPQSCRRAVSLLQSRYHYPETEFRRLLRFADQMDREHL